VNQSYPWPRGCPSPRLWVGRFLVLPLRGEIRLVTRVAPASLACSSTVLFLFHSTRGICRALPHRASPASFTANECWSSPPGFSDPAPYLPSVNALLFSYRGWSYSVHILHPPSAGLRLFQTADLREAPVSLTCMMALSFFPPRYFRQLLQHSGTNRRAVVLWVPTAFSVSRSLLHVVSRLTRVVLRMKLCEVDPQRFSC